MRQLIESVASAVNSVLPPELTVFLISMLPVIELKGGMVAAVILSLDWKLAMLLCVLGNILPVPFILFFIKKTFELLKLTRFKKIICKIESKVYSKSDKVTKYRHWGLYLFVAISLPGTGAWMASLIAALLGMKIKQAFLSISAGVVTSAIIMAIFSYGIKYLV